eukprot:385139-Prymnesium_polylepis.1
MGVAREGRRGSAAREPTLNAAGTTTAAGRGGNGWVWVEGCSLGRCSDIGGRGGYCPPLIRHSL